jgi:hypothetical protein
LGWEPVTARLGTLVKGTQVPNARVRIEASLDTLAVMRAFLVCGCGFGSFRHIFPAFARESLHIGRWHHAHDDWAEMLAEGGIVGGVLAGLCLVMFVHVLRTRFPDARTHPRRFVLGCLIGVIGVWVHSLGDYSLHKTGNAVLFAAIAGLCLAAVHMRPRPTREDEDAQGAGMPEEVEPGPGVVRQVVICLFLVGVTGMMVAGAICLRGELAFKRFEYGERLVARLNGPGELEEAVRVAAGEAETMLTHTRCNPDELREIASAYLRWGLDRRLSVDTRLRLSDETVRYAVLAVRAAPTDYLAWLTLGRGLALTGKWDEAEMCRARAETLIPHGPKPALFAAE